MSETYTIINAKGGFLAEKNMIFYKTHDCRNQWKR
jgi:hypothetical protein